MESEGNLAVGDHSAVYTMRAVCRRTGLSAHVIRIWERRYRAVEPVRTEGNMRRFSEEDIRRLSMLRTLSSRGHGIGQVARLPTSDLERLIALSTKAEEEMAVPGGTESRRPAASLPQISVPGGTAKRPLAAPEERQKGAESRRPGGTPSDDPPGQDPPAAVDHQEVIHSYLAAVQGFASKQSLELLFRASRGVDRRIFLYEVMLPILREVGAAWESGRLSIAHEHLVSAQLEAVLHGLRGDSETLGPRIVITTPAGHRHTFGALVATLLASIHGFEPIYIGGDMPDVDLLDAIELAKPLVLLLCILREPSAEESVPLEATLTGVAARVETWIAHPAGHSVSNTRASVRRFEDFATFEAALAERRGVPAGSSGPQEAPREAQPID